MNMVGVHFVPTTKPFISQTSTTSGLYIQKTATGSAEALTGENTHRRLADSEFHTKVSTVTVVATHLICDTKLVHNKN